MCLGFFKLDQGVWHKVPGLLGSHGACSLEERQGVLAQGSYHGRTAGEHLADMEAIGGNKLQAYDEGVELGNGGTSDSRPLDGE